MRIDIISAVPKLLESPLGHSIVGRAQKKGLVTICVHDLRDFTDLPHRQIDDYPYGGAAGMVLMAPPIARAIRHLQGARTYDEVIYFAPEAPQFSQTMANRYALAHNIILLCGHYKGIDERIRQRYITREISLGPFVLSGGEIAAAAFTDSIVRLIPGALGDSSSALTDSFQNGRIAPPIYTRPAVFEGMAVPEPLLSGNHARIRAWEEEQIEKATRRYNEGK